MTKTPLNEIPNAGNAHVGYARILGAIAAVGIGSCFAADVTLDGVVTYDVASGATTTLSDRLTGTGGIKKTGLGTLALSNGANDFTMGVSITQGVVQVTAAGALGATTGAVTIGDQHSDKATMTKLELNPTADCTFANPIRIVGKTAEGVNANEGTDGRWSLYFGAGSGKTVTLTGGLTATRNFRLRSYNTTTTPTTCAGPTVIFDSAVNAAGRTIYIVSYGDVTFKKALTADTVYFGDCWSAGGTVHLCSADNAVSNWYFDNERVICSSENVLAGGKLSWFSTQNSVTEARASLDLNGKNQTVSGVASQTPKKDWSQVFAKSGDYQCVKSSAAATLTIIGSTSVTAPVTYTTVRGAVSIVVNATDKSFVQTFCRHVNPTTGSLTVTKGTLKLDSASFPNVPSLTVGAEGSFTIVSTNSTPALAGVKTLSVDGTFDATGAAVNPFSGTLTSVTIGKNAQLKLPSGSVLSAASVTVEGTTYTSAALTSANVPQLGEGVTVLATGSPTAATWTGSGANENLTTAANWASSPTLPNLTYGQTHATFATGGSSAIVDTDAIFNGLVLDAPNGFTFARAATPKTLTVMGDIAVTGDSANVPAYVFDTPMKFLGETRTITMTGGPAQFVFKNALAADDALTGTLQAEADVTNLVFAGTNVIAGRLAIRHNPVEVSGLIATPDHAYEGRPANAEANAIRVVLSGNSGNPDLAGLILSNAVIEKAINIYNKIGVSSVATRVGTTNEIHGFVKFEDYSHEKFFLRKNSLLTLSGGLETVHSFRIYNGGTLRIEGRPASFPGSAGLNPVDGKVVLAVAGNTFNNLCVGYNANYVVTIETEVDFAITNGHWQVGGNGGHFDDAVALSTGTYTMDLHATTQRCQCVGVMKQGILKGEYPAMLEVTEGRPATGALAKFGYSIVGQVNGGVGFHMCGDAGSVLLLTNRVFASCGDLKVSSGTLEFAEATWPNGTNVTVSGSGTLKVTKATKGTPFNRHAVLRLGADEDAWQIDLPSDLNLRFREAYDADGARLPPGVYGNAAVSGVNQTRYSGHFPTTGGTVRVAGGGMIILFK